MADTNWIKLNRKIWDNFLWNFEKPQYAMAWIDLLLMANYKDKQIMFDGKVETIQRGSFVTSMVKLSERWCMNRKTVKGFLDVLQESGMITYTTSKKCTTIFITNYLVYQGFPGFEGEDTTQQSAQLTAQLTTQQSAQLTAHNIRSLKKIKESKKVKEDIGGDSPAAPPTKRKVFQKPSVDDVRSYCQESGYHIDAERFINYYESNGWMVGRNKMKDWKATVRGWASRDKGKPTSQTPADYGSPEDFYK